MLYGVTRIKGKACFGCSVIGKSNNPKNTMGTWAFRCHSVKYYHLRAFGTSINLAGRYVPVQCSESFMSPVTFKNIDSTPYKTLGGSDYLALFVNAHLETVQKRKTNVPKVIILST